MTWSYLKTVNKERFKGAAEVFYLPPEITATIRVLCFWLELLSSVSNYSHMFHIKMKDNPVSLKDQTRFSSRNHALVPWLHNQARMDLLHPRDFPAAANIWHHSHAGHQHLKLMGSKWHLHVFKAGNAEDFDRWAGSQPASTLALSATSALATSLCYHRPPPVRDCCWAIEKQLTRTTCFPSVLGCNLAQEKNKKVQQTAFMTTQAFWLLCVSCSKTCSDPCPLPALESLCHQCDWSHCQQ